MSEPDRHTSYTPDEICKFARRDELPDGGLCLIEHLLWYKLRDIYNEHAMGVISASDGAERKREALSWAEQEWEKKCRDDELVYRCARLWKNVEEAAAEYRKNRTIQNADLLMASIYGIALNAVATEVISDE